METRKPRLVPGYLIYGAFALGLLTAIAFRAIIVIDHVRPSWVRPMWYFAVLGNLLFFLYRFKITQKRKHAVDDFRLIQKIKSHSDLEPEDREALVYLLSSIKVSFENRNYFIIFIFSVIAIAVDIALSMIE
jgi:hypothetical protein